VTPEKQKQKLAGQSSIAQKVFQFVPINELWTPLQIAQALHRDTRSNVDMHVLRGCLNCLVDAGIVKTNNSGTYRRVTVSAQPAAGATESAKPKESSVSVEPKTTIVKNDKPASAIDLLSGIAKKMRAMADEIENAALTIEEERAKDAETVNTARQFREFLKGLA